MRVGVYVDAFNVYYGARDHCGRGSAGWRWLDLIGLGQSLADDREAWRKRRPFVTRLVYCTAIRTKDDDLSSERDQDEYIKALSQDERVVVELGQYNPKFGKGVLTRKVAGRKRDVERIVSPGQANFPPGWPFGEVRGASGEMHVGISYASYEEKGSDVNLATHLIQDVLERRIDAAIVISNDGDLRYPLSVARLRIPVGLVNPSRRPTSMMLKGTMSEGVGGHWWTRLNHEAFRTHQLPEEINGYRKPPGW